ncbi:uncharacterized protein AMSG_12046 [Thecamonas trahens ATCC 50062]|uniref:Uncharacterized protein n=1 Tax=Thecamonas trahens ATCC 50062 TaxID=461836 RepID=A0A0L0DFA5_THETB|nr:hypothetical protein AMSG_12046 [Thecamonas trahens ATCC 50062]KNC50905.1 hypothetical protein AMSG_12046 [Thecamonas trahens ATCC 50062]|eukprot:XP_013756674.1 hypothetical protein AMSG_12046 [Thecamonas trahens ATCC 50062]
MTTTASTTAFRVGEAGPFGGQRQVRPAVAEEAQRGYQTSYFEQVVDHFEFTEPASVTFKQRYLHSSASFGRQGSPIFFYTGNEDEITAYAEAAGAVWEAADAMGAAVVFAEHRYFGESLPFGKATFNHTGNLRWLTIEQALADYALLITALKDPSSPHYLAPGAEHAPVITFGGSYGGILSAFFRAKYPNIVAGAIASSAPVWSFVDTAPDGGFGFNRWTTKTWADQCEGVFDVFQPAWAEMTKLAASPTGLARLTATFSLCKPLASAAQVENALFARLSAALSYLAMADYTFATSFFAPLPANPIRAACDIVGRADSRLDALAGVAALFYNYTGAGGDCFDINQGQPSSIPAVDITAWTYLYCTEITLDFGGADGIHDFFAPAKPDIAGIAAACAQQFPGIVSRPSWITTHFLGRPIRGASNIVFANGMLDPCSSGTPLTNQSASIIALNIADGAHHSDLFASRPSDPPSVVAARLTEQRWIAKWIAEWNDPTLSTPSELLANPQTFALCSIIVSYLLRYIASSQPDSSTLASFVESVIVDVDWLASKVMAHQTGDRVKLDGIAAWITCHADLLRIYSAADSEAAVAACIKLSSVWPGEAAELHIGPLCLDTDVGPVVRRMREVTNTLIGSLALSSPSITLVLRTYWAAIVNSLSPCNEQRAASNSDRAGASAAVVVKRPCRECTASLPQDAFAPHEWNRSSGEPTRVCIKCAAAGSAQEPNPPKVCAMCGVTDRAAFAINMWRTLPGPDFLCINCSMAHNSNAAARASSSTESSAQVKASASNDGMRERAAVQKCVAANAPIPLPSCAVCGVIGTKHFSALALASTAVVRLCCNECTKAKRPVPPVTAAADLVAALTKAPGEPSSSAAVEPSPAVCIRCGTTDRAALPSPTMQERIPSSQLMCEACFHKPPATCSQCGGTDSVKLAASSPEVLLCSACTAAPKPQPKSKAICIACGETNQNKFSGTQLKKTAASKRRCTPCIDAKRTAPAPPPAAPPQVVASGIYCSVCGTSESSAMPPNVSAIAPFLRRCNPCFAALKGFGPPPPAVLPCLTCGTTAFADFSSKTFKRKPEVRRCKACTAAKRMIEPTKAVGTKAAAVSCSICGVSYRWAFSTNQWQKPPQVPRRCKKCIANAKATPHLWRVIPLGVFY